MSQSRCLVCNLKPGDSHDHYGCIGVCSSCRNFFQRAAQSQNYQVFKCRKKDQTKGAECKINSLNRTSCQKCRFKKCLHVGMKTAFVKPRTPGSEIPANNSICKSPNLNFTTEEEELSQQMKSFYFETVHTKYFEFAKDDVETFRNWIALSLEGRILPFEIMKTMERIDIFVLTDIGLKFLNLQDELTGIEQFFLIKSNVKKLISFMWAVFNERIDTLDFISKLINYGQLHPDTIGAETVLPAIQNIQTNNNSGISGYDTIYSTPWAPHFEIETRHSELSKAISRWARPSSTELPDQIQILLITMIILLSSDHTELTSPKQKSKIENLQLKFIIMYQRYLKQTYPKESNSRLAGGIMLLQHAEELHQLNSQRLPI